MILWLFVGSAMAAEFFVAASGNDVGDGTRQQPFATLQRARDAIRSLKRQQGLSTEGVTVWVARGIYRFEETLRLDREDSGDVGAPIVYRSWPGHIARLTGGPSIPAAAFHPAKDPAVLQRLQPVARGKVLQTELGKLGIQAFGNAWPDRFKGYAGWPELFFDGEPMRIARWPNEGFAKAEKVLDRGSCPRENEKPDRGGRFQRPGSGFVFGF